MFSDLQADRSTMGWVERRGRESSRERVAKREEFLRVR